MTTAAAPPPPATADSPRRPGPFRRHKALTVIGAVLLVLVLVVVGWLLYLRHELDDVSRFDVDLDRPDRPAAVPGAPVTILLAGVDVNQGGGSSEDLRNMLESGEWEPGSYRSDAIMVLSLDPKRDEGVLISIPRDSLVDIEGQGRTKVNAALSVGGPELLTRTVEDLTDHRIDHVMMVDFEGFRDVTAVIGGVEVQIPETVYDSKLKKEWTAGTHTIEGEEALLYVRQRYGLTMGDLDRVQRQQNFLRAVMRKVTSTEVLRNPVTITKLVADLSDLIAVDSGLSTDRMRSMALANRGLRASDLSFFTIPNDGPAMVDGASVVLVDVATVRGMFDALERDRFDRWLATNDAPRLPAPDQVD